MSSRDKINHASENCFGEEYYGKELFQHRTLRRRIIQRNIIRLKIILVNYHPDEKYSGEIFLLQGNHLEELIWQRIIRRKFIQAKNIRAKNFSPPENIERIFFPYKEFSREKSSG
jgi:hypothetical protein